MSDVASRDQNFVPTLLAVSSVDGVSPVTVYANPVTHRLLVSSSGGGTDNITVGLTTITSGTTTRILYDNAGVLGEYTLTGTGTVVAMQTAPSFLTSVTTPSVLASSNDSGALGASGTAFSDLFLASGGVINWNAGDVTITHSANTLSFAGASSGYNFDTQILIGTADVMVVHGATINSQLEINNDTQAAIEVHTHSNTAGNGGVTYAARSRGTTASPLVVQNADIVRVDAAVGYDGTDYELLGYTIWSVGGTPGNNDMPGQYIIAITPDGGFTPATALTINQDKSATFAGVVSMTSPSITTATFNGAQQLAEGASIRLDAVLSADGAWSGTTIAGTAGTTLAFGDLVYLAVADSRWELTDADSVTTAGAVWTGMCVLAAASDGDPTVILLQGNIRADANFPALTVGAPVYASTSPGDIQVAQPNGTDDVIHVVGFAITADSIYFNPSQDYITHT